jgi:hypothetical protein
MQKKEVKGRDTTLIDSDSDESPPVNVPGKIANPQNKRLSSNISSESPPIQPGRLIP